MSQTASVNATFNIERRFNLPPAQVFNAWADPATKARWFVGPRGKWKEKIREFSFRVGGRERLVGTLADGTLSAYDARYLEIVPSQLIVYQYDMYLNDKRISISLASVDFLPAATGTRMNFTERAIFLDGFNDAGGRKKGTLDLLDGLGALLGKKPAG